jgi:hypothetical protein
MHDALLPVQVRVTHLAEKALQMRHKIPTHLHNRLKKRALQRHV